MARSFVGRLIPLALAGAGLWYAQRKLRESAYSFRDKVVLIAGGTRGLGLVMARQLLDEGAQVAICGRDQATLDRAAEQLRGRGRVLAIPCDIGEQTQVQELVHQVTDTFGHIDVLINNAGVISVGPLEAMTLEDFELAMRVHFWGPLYTTIAALPTLSRRRGRIVNISSIGGKMPVPHLTPYCASKFALVGLSESLRAELSDAGITVTTVAPGLMRTGSPRNALFKGQHRKEYAWFVLGDSLPGLSMNAEEAARQVLDACRRGDAEIVLSLPAKLATMAYGLAPGAVTRALSLVDRMLPGFGGIGSEWAKGSQSESAVTASPLTALTREAAIRNNEVG